MFNEKIFIDFDGVIVDSEDRVIKRREKDNDINREFPTIKTLRKVL